MIADIYYCPHCGTKVYLSSDEEYCPLCAETNIDEMELIERDVDLEQDKALGDNAIYANFDHYADVMKELYGEDTGLYLLDCWKFAWNTADTDSGNIEKVFAFTDNPSSTIKKERTEPMSREELQAEIERIINVILSKSKFPRNDLERQNNILSSINENYPLFRLFVKNDLTRVSAEVCYFHTRFSKIYDYIPVEKDNPVPKRRDDYIMFTGGIRTNIGLREDFNNTAKHLSESVVLKFIKKWKVTWKQTLQLMFHGNHWTYYLVKE